jgi:hypothetical protein
MAMICTNVTEWITTQVTNPVSSWVNQQQQQCNNYPWPINWFCKIVTVLVEVINWVVTNVLTPIIKVVCIFVTTIIGGVLLPFAAAIDSVCQKCNAYDWVMDWFIGCSKIEGQTETPSTTTAGAYDFTFKCNCTCLVHKIVKVTAKTEEEAFNLAKIECEKACS